MKSQFFNAATPKREVEPRNKRNLQTKSERFPVRFSKLSALLECVLKVFAIGSDEVGYADTSGVSCWRD
jgi:hypothetical protein